ncbi:flavonoid 3'-monooxygenase [Selaginella moellendorffii]|uniref:flavonoid 3'-monooxygenase n=1 Tax=Selaginella moellendorffii TaxID=88036 RepID=UPI000D1C2776|nr:flavonoid 3'-monooxygenase [Selaginella moellendorffii]|eukprot:XP_024542853.1 flavonoid 3'-monooxygenase [Selaginella moellendorffii]
MDPETVEFKEVAMQVLDFIFKPSFSNFVPWYLRWMDWELPYYKQVHASQDRFIQKIVEEHKHSTRENKDFLDIMLQFYGPEKETQVKANLIWMLAAMMENPRVMRKAQEELQQVVGDSRMVQESDLPKLEYFQMIIKETFRRYPAGILLSPRIASQDTKIGGYDIPKGTTLLLHAWALGMDPSVWENPTEFLPERFVGSTDVKGVQDFNLLPFGCGRRKCPGMPLGLRTVHFLVANLVHGFDWSYVPGTVPSMEETPTGACQLKTPLEAVATMRLPKHAYTLV